MDFPYQLGPLQIVLTILAFIAICTLLQSLRFRDVRPADGLCSLGIAVICLVVLYASVAIQAYAAGAHSRVAHIHATKVANAPDGVPALSVDLTLYNQSGGQPSEHTYLVRGDEWMLQADVITVSGAMTVIGLHSGYKLTRLAGRFDDPRLERSVRRSVVVLNGGDDAFFQFARSLNSLLAPFIDAEYGSAAFAGAGSFDIYESQQGLWAKGV